MAKKSAGLLVYHYNKHSLLEVLLVHPGGPFYKNKDDGVWSIPKGEYDDDEQPLEVAKREFFEETGNTIQSEKFIPLQNVKIKSGKIITAWAVEQHFDEPFICSNKFSMEWPPKSGQQQMFDEVDRAAYFDLATARKKIYPSQWPLLDELLTILKSEK